MAPTIEPTFAISTGEAWYASPGIYPSLEKSGDHVFANDYDLGLDKHTPLGVPPFDHGPDNGSPYYGVDFGPYGGGGVKNCSGNNTFLNDMKSFFAPSQVVVPIIYCVICLIGLIGNGLVIFVIVGSKEMTKSVANIYILNLAIADTLLLVTLPFTSTQRVLLAWPFGVGMCKIVEAIKYLNYFASIFFLTAMSIDRYFAVVYVVTSSRYRTNRNTFFVCLMVWLLSFVMVIPLLIYTKLQGEMCALIFNMDSQDNAAPDDYVFDLYYDYEDNPCASDFYSSDFANMFPIDQQEGGHSGEGLSEGPSFVNFSSDTPLLCKHPESRTFHVFIIFTFVIGFVVPLTIITLCYAMIVIRLLQPSETRSRSRQADRTRRKVTRMVIALVVVFFICWLPFYTWHLVQIGGINVTTGVCHNVRDFTFCLCFANSCLNPLLYTFLGHNFQERLRKSIAMSLRSFTFSNFTRYTTNTASRADTGVLSKRMEATHTEPPADTITRANQLLAQMTEEEPCLPVYRDATRTHHNKS